MTDPTGSKNFAAREPVVVSAVVAWLFSLLGTFIIGHTSLIDSTTWSGLSTTLVPIVSAAILTVIAYVTRRFVAPAWKLLVEEAKHFGVSQDQLTNLVKTEVVDELNKIKTDNPELAPVISQVLAAKKAGKA